MNILRFLAVFVMLFLVLSPTNTNAEDTEGPVITNIEVVSSGDYDLEKPLLRYWNYSIGGETEYPVGTVGSELIFSIQALDELSSVKSVSIEVKKNSTTETVQLTTEDYLNWSTEFTFSDDDVGEFEISKVTAEDNAGNVNEVSPPNFRFYILPSDYKLYNEQALGITDTLNKIKISFSEEMDSNTLTNNNIMLLESTTQSPHYVKSLSDYDISVTDDDQSIIINRNNNFLENRNYIVVIHKRVSDISGNTLENPMYINFKYVKSDTPPPSGWSSSSNRITNVPHISPDYAGKASELWVVMDDRPALQVGDRFRLLLPSGVSWSDFYLQTGEIGDLSYTKKDDRTLEFEVKNETTEFKIPLDIRLEGALGELKVVVDALDSPLTNGTYTFAVAGISQ